MPKNLLAIPFASSLLTAALAGQTVWTVGPPGTAQFAQIHAAIAAAADGDVIVVAQGAYAPIVVDGKGLVILGSGMILTNGGPSAVVGPAVTVRNLTAQQRVVLLGFTVFNASLPPAALHVHDCTGPVWLQDLFVDSYGAGALRVERCAAVVLQDTFAQTNSSPALANGTPAPAPGAHVEASHLYGYDSEAHGSHNAAQGAGLPVPNAPAPGGPGLLAKDAWIEWQGGRLRGGGGGSFFTGTCSIGASGGDALVLVGNGGTPPEVRLRDVDLAPGYGGFYQASCATPSSPGATQTILAGTVVALPGDSRSLRGGGRVPAGQVRALELHGRTGDLAFVFAAPTALPVTLLDLPVHLGLPVLSLGLRAIGSTGLATLQLAVPPLPAGMQCLPIAAQALFLDLLGVPFASGPVALIVL